MVDQHRSATHPINHVMLDVHQPPKFQLSYAIPIYFRITTAKTSFHRYVLGVFGCAFTPLRAFLPKTKTTHGSFGFRIPPVPSHIKTNHPSPPHKTPQKKAATSTSASGRSPSGGPPSPGWRAPPSSSSSPPNGQSRAYVCVCIHVFLCVGGWTSDGCVGATRIIPIHPHRFAPTHTYTNTRKQTGPRP